MKKSLSWCVMLGTLITSCAVQAASVSSDVGEVLVNKGSGFVVAAGSVPVASDDQVMVRPGGAAVISYSDTCSVRVGADRIWTVQPKAPCVQGSTFVDLTGKMGQQSDAGSTSDDNSALLVGALAIGAVVGAVILFSDDDDKCVSAC